MEHGRLGEARAARRCGLLRRAALASAADGRYDDASRAIERAGPLPGETAVQAALDADVHMLGGRDETAADALERAAAHTTREGLAAMLPAVAWNPRAEAFRCAADALRARHGDAAARAHLAMRARDALPHCALLWAHLIPPGEARRAAVEQHSPHSDNAVAWLLLSAEGEGPERAVADGGGEPREPGAPQALVLNPTSMLAVQLPGLEEPVLARLRLRSPDARTGELRAWLELRAALYASAMGNSPQAIRFGPAGRGGRRGVPRRAPRGRRLLHGDVLLAGDRASCGDC